MPVSYLPPDTAQPTGQHSTGENSRTPNNDSGHSRVPQIAGLLVVAVIPFWLIPISHLISRDGQPTGFFQYELPYYVANGRSAFERGNGFSYPNPYDPAADSPPVYAHWFPWTLGFATAVCGLDPGETLLVVAIFASLAFALSTYRLVSCRNTRESPLGFLLAMWGGGFLVIAGLTWAFVHQSPLGQSTLHFDPGMGMWFLNWGRNSLFPTEALYHALVATCWIAEIRCQHRHANICLILLATTHPWSGLELLLTVNLWRLVQLATVAGAGRSKPIIVDHSATVPTSEHAENDQVTSAGGQLAISLTALVGFLAYYKIWLPSFPEHAQLQNVWELNWSLPWTSALLAYGPVCLPAAIQLAREWTHDKVQTSSRFLICALIVATGLAFHDRIIRPVQPLHFTRGYVWMPLFLIGLPTTLRWLRNLRDAGQTRTSMLTSVIIIVAFLDNTAFSWIHSVRQWQGQDGFHMDTDERSLCAALNAHDQTQGRIIMSDSEQLNYLLPTYAAVRPWLGHHFNTPQFPDRRKRWAACFEEGIVHPGRIPPEVETIAVRSARNQDKLASSGEWERVAIRNASWDVWRRHAETIVN